MIALQSTRDIVPGRRHKVVLAREILNQGFICRLHEVISWGLDVTLAGP